MVISVRPALQYGVVEHWHPSTHPETDMASIAAEIASQKRQSQRGVRLQLVGYLSDWRNGLHDKNNRVTVWLRLASVEGSYKDFIYVGWRIAGTRPGDKTASLHKEVEWFEIHVTRSEPSSRSKEEVSVTWKRIATPR
ncbi:MAG: hypothetical protein JWO54_731 [Candidatus Saccharibacteria bacterium]|nr:hypothetical protein [Candidatus Saccharibacteria bacterium]